MRLIVFWVFFIFTHPLPLLAQEISKGSLDNKTKNQTEVSVPADDSQTKSSIQQELLAAMAAGDASALGRLLRTGVDPDMVLSESGKTLLMAAESTSLVELLLGHGADPKRKDEAGATAAHHAVMKRDVRRIISLLIDHGADINSTDNMGYTPLIHAVVNDKPDVVELLLTLGADNKIKSNEGQTALDWAEELGFVDIVELLETARSGY